MLSNMYVHDSGLAGRGVTQGEETREELTHRGKEVG
jgi:hypothetical protein